MTPPTTATAILRREHELILAVVEVLQGIADTDAGSAIDHEVASRCVSFIRLFADLCHHGKEEDLLFPALTQQGLPADEGPIAVMLEEHEQGRALVREMVGALAKLRSGDATARSWFTSAAQGYIDLIRQHIAKENTILFEMADNLVVGDDCRKLCERYAAVDGGQFEERSKLDLEQMAAELVAR